MFPFDQKVLINEVQDLIEPRLAIRIVNECRVKPCEVSDSQFLAFLLLEEVPDDLFDLVLVDCFT